jgi:hypothetical protein
MLLVVGGVGLLIVAAVSAVIGVRDWPLWNALRRVRPTTPERLAKAARDGRLDGRVVAVSGLAGAAPSGPLRSAVNNEACVWHRHLVHRRQISHRGAAQRASRRRRVADVASHNPFLLRGLLAQPSAARAAVAAGASAVVPTAGGPPADGGPVVVEVHPEGLRIHRPVRRRIRILPGLASEPFPPADVLIGQVTQLFWHREWLLPAGTPLFVLAEVQSHGSRLALRRPARGPHVVSTRRAGWLRIRTALSVLVGFTLAVAGAAAGAAALVIHYV